MSASKDISQSIQNHLDGAGASYLSSINDTRPESAVAMTQRLAPLLQFLKPGSTVVSIGVGQGEELCGLYDLFGGNVRIIALDISQVALDQAKLRVERNSFDVSFVHADATKVPLEDESVDGVILSSTLHEIYSYNPDGFSSFLGCLQEIKRILRKEGVVFVRDFAAPDTNEVVTLRLRTPIAMKFYEWFRHTFRRFSSWGDVMDKSRLDETYLPSIGNGIIRLPLDVAAEMLLHFRSFWSDYQKGDVRIGDTDWKESDEMYLVKDGHATLTPKQYIEVVGDGLGDGFELVFEKINLRNKTNTFLANHFTLLDDSGEDRIANSIRKIECIFQKERTVKKHYAAAVIFNQDGGVLLCKRAAYKKIAPNVWHLPGGAIEAGEDPLTAVSRELKEELDLDTIASSPTHVTLTYPIEEGSMQTHCFFVEVSNEPTILNAENSEWRFIPPSEFESYLEPHLVEDNLKAVRAAQSLRDLKND